jgi:hypothetical protein
MAYPWHPIFGRELDVLYVEQRSREQVYICRQQEGSTVALPSWMFQPGICSQMKLGQPRLSLHALEGLRGILSEIAFHQQQVAGAAPMEEINEDNAAESEPALARSRKQSNSIFRKGKARSCSADTGAHDPASVRGGKS